jgi:hypothetical protein
MARANAEVDHVRGMSRTVEPAPPGRTGRELLELTLENGRTGRLDLSQHRSAVWADVLESRQRSGQPVYIETDPASGLVTELLLPMSYRVVAIEPVEDGLAVRLDVSHAVHRVRRANPDFEEIRTALEAARDQGTQVLVTDSLDGSEIIDVRPPVRQPGTAG